MMYFADYAVKTEEQIFSEFNTSTRGLREFDARERLDTFGPNKISGKQVTWRDILFRQFKSPFVYLLFFASVFSFFTDGIADGIIIFVFILINALLGFVQEYNSEQALVALKQFVRSTSRVRRNGNEMLVDSEDVVPGDVLILATGDMIPADVRFFKINNVIINEEPLTGESAPVYKTIEPAREPAKSIQEARMIGFAGTTLEQGSAEGIVLATGTKTFMGGIAKLTIETNRESGFEKGIAQFSRFILRMIIGITVLIFIANVFLKGGGQVAETILFAIALAISVVPEALPVVTTISLSRGALELARNKVVIRRLSAIEDLGGIEVLCSDKTGTITENKLSVVGIYASDENACLEYANLGSSFLGQKRRDPNNSFDLALWEKLTESKRHDLKQYSYISERPFDPEKRTNSVLMKQDGKNILIVRGAPEEILKISRGYADGEKERVLSWAAAEGSTGRRTIAVAIKVCDFDRAHCIDDECELTFIGAISFSDRLKPTAKEAIARAGVLGVQIKILTGDGPEVSRAVAMEVGILKDGERVITGDEFEAMTAEEQETAVVSSHVFTRLNPRQKYEIIGRLQKHFSVGFLGEGINDSPALKLANVALVVDGAADIAREAADIVLLNRSLLSIVEGIESGRKIFGNIVKYLKITLISNFGNFYSVAIASLLIPFLPMLPIQILLLNLLSDFPMIAIATDSIDSAELARPKSYESGDIVRMSVLFGLISTVFDLAVFAIFYHRSPATLQTNWFVVSVLTELALIYSMRTKLPFWKTLRPGRMLVILSAAGVLIALVLPFTPLGTGLFRFSPPSPADVRTILLLAVSYFTATEMCKRVYVKIQEARKQKKKNMLNTKIILASDQSFLLTYGYDLVGIEREKMKIGYVTTAAKVATTTVNDDIKREIIAAGYPIEEIDIEGKTEDELRRFFADKNVIHVGGGNTFYLLKIIRETGFSDILKELIDSGKTYIGMSAGAYVMCPTIDVANWDQTGKNRFGMIDFTALNYVPFVLKVHYTDSAEVRIREMLPTLHYPLRILRDGQGILVEHGMYTFVGKGEEVKLS